MTRTQGQPPRGRATRWCSSEKLCGWSRANGISQANGQELDDETLGRAGRGHVEWKPQSLIVAGELVFGTAWGALVGASIADLADVDAAGLAMEQI